MEDPAQRDAGAVADGATQVLSASELGRATRIADRYELTQRLGKGGFGHVFRARDSVLDRVVAIKTLDISGEGAEAPGRFDSFLQEARTIAKFDHPAIVPVYDAGVDGSTPWIAMRLVEGESLASLLDREGPLGYDEVVALLRPVLGGLEHAHHRGVVHRDLKPSNILVEEGEGGVRPYIADFGLAKTLSERATSVSGSISGTPSYMSPEQITGRRVDGRTDLFALGCIIYQSLIGSRPFSGGTLTEVAYKIVHTQPERLAELGKRFGPKAGELARRALAKSPEDRFQAAAEMLQALEGAATGTEVRRARGWAPLKRRRARGEEPWDGGDVLVVDGLSMKYGFRKKALDGLNLRVPYGAIFALLGRNGAGKTTLIRNVLGIYRPDRGTVKVFGRDVRRHPTDILARVGYVPESLTAYEWLTVGELLDFLRRCYPNWDNAYCYQLLARYDLPVDTKLKHLSRGMQTKVSLVSALAHRPDFLVMDDPTIGLDAVTLDEFFETLREVSHAHATTVLISSHNIPEVETVATHVGFIGDGQITFSDTLDGLRARTREVRLTFEDDAPPLQGVDGFKTTHISGRRVTGFVLDHSSGAIERLRALQPQELEVRELGLKEIFISLMK